MTLPKLNNDIIEVIAKYLINPEYKLLDWIDINNINYISLKSNPHPKAISMLNGQDIIAWISLSLNPNTNTTAIQLLRENPDKILWCQLSLNPNAISPVSYTHLTLPTKRIV